MSDIQLNKAELLASEISDTLKQYFGDKITSTFTFSRLQEQSWIEFSIEFEAYNYFNLICNYDRGTFGCAIVNGSLGIRLPNSQE